jgi:hypothetical protein
MSTTIDPNAIFSGAPTSLTYGGVECGATIGVPKISLDVSADAPVFKNAGGPVEGTRGIRTIIPSVEVTVNEITAQKLAWAMPGATATSSESVGVPLAGLDTTLAADPALGATTLKVDSVTTVTLGDFVRVAAASVTATEANSEILRVTRVGTTGGGGTGIDVENSAGGGCLLDHASAAEIKTITGTILAAPAAAGDTSVKCDAVSAFTVGEFIRIGYVGHYEAREIATKGSAGPSGTGLGFVIPLSRDHGLDEWVVEVASLGGTTIRPVVGRIDSSAYKDLVITDVGADGRTLIVTLENATSAESQSLEMDDDPANPLGLVLKFTGHYAAATPRTVPITFLLD